ncbi:hypothetical protein [Halpernia sp. GG3]
MVNKILLSILFSSFCISCCYNGLLSEYGLPRKNFNNFKIDGSTLKKIDTMAVYKLDAHFVKEKNSSKNLFYEKFNYTSQIFLKFYSKGKMGHFRIHNQDLVKFDLSTFDPRKAEMGYYSEYKQNNIKIKFSSIFECKMKISEYEGYFEKDSLVLFDQNNYGSIYKKVEIQNNFVKDKNPDW